MSDQQPKSILEQGLALVQDDLASLPPGTKGALFAVAAADGVRVGVAGRAGRGWKFIAEAVYDVDAKQLGGRAAVVKTW